VAPSDAERMSGRVGVGLVSLVRFEIGRRLEKTSSQSHRFFVRGSGIVDVEVEMDLLRGSIGPIRRNVVRRELHADPPLTGGVDDRVPTVVLEHSPAENPGPERTLGAQICGIEHDHLPHHTHSRDCRARERRPAPGFLRAEMRRADMRQSALMRRSSAFVLITGLLLSACATSTKPPSSLSPTKVRTYPVVPVGGTDCGITNEMSGWPTTTVPGPAIYSCLSRALSSGRPARLVVIHPSNVDSGRTTSDGYAIPAAVLVTYRVFGPKRLEVTTDRREAGGPVSTQNCTGLALQATGSAPTLRGCKPGQ
jgi:hypothetical protein